MIGMCLKLTDNRNCREYIRGLVFRKLRQYLHITNAAEITRRYLGSVCRRSSSLVSWTVSAVPFCLIPMASVRGKDGLSCINRPRPWFSLLLRYNAWQIEELPGSTEACYPS